MIEPKGAKNKWADSTTPRMPPPNGGPESHRIFLSHKRWRHNLWSWCGENRPKPCSAVEAKGKVLKLGEEPVNEHPQPDRVGAPRRPGRRVPRISKNEQNDSRLSSGWDGHGMTPLPGPVMASPFFASSWHHCLCCIYCT